MVERADWMTRVMTFCVWIDSLPPLRMAALPASARVSSGGASCGESERTGLDRESGDVDDDFGPRLEYDEQDTNRTCHSVQVEPFVELAGIGDLSSRVGERVDVEDALQHRVVLVGG